jgi:hypothetical protein
VADEPVELDGLVFDGLEQGTLADGLGTGVDGIVRYRTAFWADDGDLPVALYGVG